MMIEKKEANSYAPLPENMYIVELLDVNSELRPTFDTRALPDDQKIMETVFNFHFVLLDGEENGKSLRGRSLWHNFVPSYLYISTKNGKNKLYEVIEALQKQTISPEQEAFGISGKELNGFIGKQTRVATSNTTKGDKTYSEIVKFYSNSPYVLGLSVDEKIAATPKPKEGAGAPEVLPEYPSNTIAPEDIPFPA